MARYDRSVFINCPFDEAYRTDMFRALVFAVHDCGFQTRCALETNNAAESRISKIERIIEECQYGIHDLSRTELDAVSNLPRFNMPLELGLFLGAKRFGSVKQKRKSALVLDTERYRYQKFISDIAGQDISAHNGKTDQAIRRVRDWLKPNNPSVSIPGGQKMASRFESFNTGDRGQRPAQVEQALPCLQRPCETDHLLVVMLGSTSQDGRVVDSRNLFRWAWQQRVRHQPTDGNKSYSPKGS